MPKKASSPCSKKVVVYVIALALLISGCCSQQGPSVSPSPSGGGVSVFTNYSIGINTPPQFNSTYSAYTGVRFLASQSSEKRLMTFFVRVDSVTKFLSILQIALTNFAPDYVRIRSQANFSNFLRRENPYVPFPMENVTIHDQQNARCGRLYTASTAGSSSLTTLLSVRDPAPGYDSPMLHEVTILAGPNMFDSQCIGYFAGTFTSGKYIAREAVLTYVYTSDVLDTASLPLPDIKATIKNSEWLGGGGLPRVFTIITAEHVGSYSTTSSVSASASQGGSGGGPTGGGISPTNLVLIPYLDDIDAVPVLGSQTARKIRCRLGDIKSFSVFRVPAGTSILFATPSDCNSHQTVTELHNACLNSDACLGFTIYQVNGEEFPLCMLVPGAVTEDSYNEQDRLYYRKPEDRDRICQVNTTSSGELAISVQQTYFATGYVSIYVDGEFVRQCGGAQPFSEGFTGKTGLCHLYALCYTGRVFANSQVTVEISSGLAQGGCDSTLDAIFDLYTLDEQQQEATPAPTLPPQLQNIESEYQGQLALAKTSSHQAPISIYVQNLRKALLKVVQTGYDCKRFGSNISACPEQIILMDIGGNQHESRQQRCGGQLGFAGGVAGKSDQCEVGKFCSDPTIINTTNTKGVVDQFSGFIHIFVDVANLASSTNLCPGFSATLLISDKSSSTSADSTHDVLDFGFALRVDRSFLTTSAQQNTFRPLLAVKASELAEIAVTAHQSLANFSPSDVRLLNPNLLPFQLGEESDPVLLFTVNDTFIGQPTSFFRQKIPASATFACVMDHITSATHATCSIPVPSRANFYTVEVAQTDFASSTNFLEIELYDNSSSKVSNVKCGGDHNFLGDLGLTEECSVYRTCSNTFLYPTGDDLMQTAPLHFLVIEVPKTVLSKGCKVAVGAIVRFEYRDVSVPSVGETPGCDFLCKADRTCISESSVCNDIQDCSDGDDEVRCSSWHHAETGMEITTSTRSTNGMLSFPNSSTYNDCRRKTAAFDGGVFSLVNGTCIVYSESFRTLFIAEPSTDLQESNDSTAQVFVRLPAGLTSYRRCSASVHCEGNGKIVVPPGGLRDGSTCVCHCSADFLGSSCSFRKDISTIRNLVVLFSNSPGILDSLDINAIQKALAADQVEASCQYFQNVSRAYIGIICSFSSAVEWKAAAHRADLLAFSISSVNEQLVNTYFHPEIAFITTETVFATFSSSTHCGGGQKTGSCSLGNATGRNILRNIRVTKLGNAKAQNMSGTVTYKDNAVISSRRATSLTAVLFTCADLVPTIVTGGCIAATCVVPVDPTREVEKFEVGVVEEHPTDTTDDCYGPVSLALMGEPGVPTTTTSVDLVLTEADFTVFLAVGSTCLGLTFILFVTAIAMHCSHTRRMNRIEKEAMDSIAGSRMTDVTKFLYETFLRLKEVTSGSGFSPQRCSVLSVLVGLVCAVIALLLILIYTTSASTTSNFGIIVEEYRDEHCEDSPFSFIPSRLFTVETDSENCEQSLIIGEALGTIYSKGTCEEKGNNQFEARITAASSEFQCLKAEERRIPSGKCVPLAVLFPATTRKHVYTRVVCSTTELIEQRKAILSSFSPLPTPNMMTTANSPADSVLQHFSGGSASLVRKATSGKTVYLSPYVSASKIRYSTSHSSVSVATTAAAEFFAGDILAARIVGQSSEVFTIRTKSSLYYPKDNNITATFQSQIQNLPISTNELLSNYVPQTADYPLGEIFNYFNTSTERTGPLVGYGSYRYYGMMGSRFDIGLSKFGAQSGASSLADGDGYSISFWFKGSTSTQGFVYALADAYENSVSLTSPVLERLLRVVSNGEPDSTWYDDWYSVYSSVFVDGFASTIKFLYANPPTILSSDENRVESLSWDLEALGMERVFNGQWHKIGIIFRVENSQAKALLIVDGETSYSKEGWSVCMGRPLREVQHLSSVFASVGVSSFQDERVTDQGVLFVGYLNGGVFDLKAYDRELSVEEFNADGTREMTIHNAIRKHSTNILGYFLIVSAIICVVITLASSGREVIRFRRKLDKETEIRALYYYASLFTKPILEPVPEGYKGERKRYKPLKYVTARRWLGVTNEQFIQFLDELKAANADLAEELISVLFAAKLNKFRRKYGNDKKKRKKLNCEDILTDDTGKLFVAANLVNDNDQTLLPLAESWERLVQADTTEYLSHRFLFVFSNPPEFDLEALPQLAVDTLTYVSNTNVTSDMNLQRLGDEHKQARVDTRGLGGDTNVTGGTGGGGGGTGDTSAATSASSGASSTVKIPDSVVQAVLPILTVLQSIQVWFTSFEMPAQYKEWYGEFLSFVSLDFVLTFPNVPAIVTPVLQLLCGILAFIFLLYFSMLDNQAFLWNLGRYARRRDEVEFSEEDDAHEEKPHGTGESDELASATVAAAVKKDQLTHGKDHRNEAKVAHQRNVTPGEVPDPSPMKNSNPASRALNAVKKVTIHGVAAAARAAKKMVGSGLEQKPVEQFKKKKERGTVPTHVILDTVMDNPYGDTKPCDYSYDVNILPVPDSARLDTFTHVAAESNVEKEERLKLGIKESYADLQELCISDHNHVEYKVIKPEQFGTIPKAERVKSLIVKPGEANPDLQVDENLELVGTHCRHHPDRVLAPQTQTVIWPFVYAPTCCVVSNGIRCSCSVGTIYSCGAEEVDSEGNLVSTCDFALCSRHFKASLKDDVKSRIAGAFRMLHQRGAPWLIALIIVVGANALYTPFVKTTLMILACHPFYQCEFTNCWSNMDQKFTIAVYLCIVMLVFFGLGLPLTQLLLLRLRKDMLQTIFFAPEYDGRYEEHDDDGDDSESDPDSDSSDDEDEAEDESKIKRNESGVATKEDELSQSQELRYREEEEEASSPGGNGAVKVVTVETGAPQEKSKDNEKKKGKKTHQHRYPPMYRDDHFYPVYRTLDPIARAGRMWLYRKLLKEEEEIKRQLAPLESTGSASSASRVKGSRRSVSALGVSVCSSQFNRRRQKSLAAEKKLAAVAGGEGTNPLPRKTRNRKPTEILVAEDADSKNPSASEWSRFLATDPTALALLYNQLEYKWLYLPPLLLAFKVILIAPAVFLEPRSFDQRLGIAAVEMFFALFIYWTAPYISPVIDGMYRLGSIHQLLILGLQNINVVRLYEGKGNLQMVMIGVTLVYLFLCICCVVWIVVWPILKQRMDANRSKDVLQELGQHYSVATSLFVVPAVGFGVQKFFKSEEDCQEEQEQRVFQKVPNGMFTGGAQQLDIAISGSGEDTAKDHVETINDIGVQSSEVQLKYDHGTAMQNHEDDDEEKEGATRQEARELLEVESLSTEEKNSEIVR